MNYQQIRRAKLKESGICVQCGKLASREGKVTCESCGIKNSESMRKWQMAKKLERRENGLCSCGKPVMQNFKTCESCKQKNKSWYYKRKQLGLCAYCGSTVNEGTRCDECSEKLRDKKRNLKIEAFEAYGGAICNCCGESQEKFLTLDHINNDGNNHRKSVGRTSVLSWLKANSYPDGFQVLCFNCNMGKHLNGGICPHND